MEQEVVKGVIGLFFIVAFLWAVAGAIRVAGLTFSKLRGTYEASQAENRKAQEIKAAISQALSEGRPMEVQQLAEYHAQALTQSRISFWFSLLFAVLGFMVVLLAGLLFADGRFTDGVVKVLAGTVIEAVAALFFAQSRKAQETVKDFFRQLRRDQQQQEARKIAETISDVSKRDEILSRLAMYYATGGEQ